MKITNRKDDFEVRVNMSGLVMQLRQWTKRMGFKRYLGHKMLEFDDVFGILIIG